MNCRNWASVLAVSGILAGWLAGPGMVRAQTVHAQTVHAQTADPVEAPPPRELDPAPTPVLRPLPINLPTALQLANAQALDIQIASERIRLAYVELQKARILWLPTMFIGTDYYRHDGQLQDIAGKVFNVSKSNFQVGAGPYMVFALSDAILSPLVQRRVLRSYEASQQAAQNDTLLAVAEAYFTVQQARGDLAGAEDAAAKAAELVRVASALSDGLAPPAEAARARAELARRRQLVYVARERWRSAGAELNRILRLDPGALVEPLEPPQLMLTLTDPATPVDDLIVLALRRRPELATQQALVDATLERLRREKLRPLVPSLLIRGGSTHPGGTLAGGLFGGGPNDFIGNFGARGDFDIQVLWELQNLGLGNCARIKEQKVQNQLAVLDLFRTQDRIAAEVSRAQAEVQAAAGRVKEAETGLREAQDTVASNLEGVRQTHRAGNLLLLITRPQEVVAAVQALALAYADYFSATADYNRAQFRLYRALGNTPGSPAVQTATTELPRQPDTLPAQLGDVLNEPPP